MRISPDEASSIVNSIKARDSDAAIYLYGSRVNDSLKGGDIDLLVVSSKLGFTDKLDLLSEIKAKIGEQKIDLTISNAKETEENPFYKKAIKSGVKLG